jgi:hypothetical protein
MMLLNEQGSIPKAQRMTTHSSFGFRFGHSCVIISYKFKSARDTTVDAPGYVGVELPGTPAVDQIVSSRRVFTPCFRARLRIHSR